MILLANLKITNKRLDPNGGASLRGQYLKTHDRMDVWKYHISSYVPLLPLISKAVIFLDIANSEYAGQEASVENHLRSLIPEDKLILNFYRNNTQKDWQQSCEEIIFPIDDNVICDNPNDDHIFLAPNIEIMQEGIDIVSRHDNPATQFCYTHWPEQTRMAHEWNWNYTDSGNFAYGSHRTIESININRKERLKHYWYSQDLGNATDYFRVEHIHNRTSMYPDGNIVYIPLREQVRHFDGYEHAGSMKNTCPPLEIPEGFANREIRIAYGYNERKPGYVNLNPSAETLYAFDGKGTDYRWALEDIPLFWKDYIAEIDINPNADLDVLRGARNRDLYNVANAPVDRFRKAPSDPAIFKNHYL
jgi:hypothetical protein